jgi:zinc/manganese transport system ATP-binding protein
MVTLENLTVSYRQHPALHHITGQFEPGSLTAVVGPNGSGKSTLLKTIMGLLPIACGKVTVATPPARIAYLPQLAEIDPHFPIDVRDCVALGCWPLKGAWGAVNGAQLRQIDSALHEVGLQGFEDRPISSLSSGQLQRVLFARLLVQNADVILLDEPFSAIDSKTTAALLDTIAQWHRQHRTVIVVLHNDAQVRQHFPQTLLLARELVAWGPTAQVMTDAHLARARVMAEVWDDDAELCEIDALAARQLQPATPAPQRELAG